MSYATAVFHLDAHPGMDDRTDQAARLAHRFDSHLVGVAGVDHGLTGLAAATGFSGTSPLTPEVGKSREQACARACGFQERMTLRRNRVSFEAVVDEEDDVRALVRRSNACDLLVLGQPDPAWPDYARVRDQVERVVMQSAAPTLLLPFAAGQSPEGDHVMIAWDGSHGAARAVAGALPLLQAARRVHLVRCETGVEIARDVDASAFDLPREWLGRHGVRVEALLEDSGTDVAAALLARAAGLGADALVMGAWGMPRWAERLVGGTTRRMLASMKLPILMAH